MIENTFQIAKGVGPSKERGIWDSGILTWRDFIDSDQVEGIKERKKQECDALFNEAYEMLDEGDSYGLGDMLKRGEQWRLFDRFKDDAAYLDIETDGLERDSLVTVVTVHRKKDTYTLTNGIDLDAASLADALDGTKILVTFNGSCFDVPVLRNSFPKVDLDMPHFDLRFGCRKVGLKGGLKNIEKEMGILRDDDIEGVDGEEAVRLWKLWEKRGDKEALRILTEYNRADTINLEGIADTIYNRLVREYARFGSDR